MPPVATLLTHPALGRQQRDTAHPCAGTRSELHAKAPENEGVKAASLLRDFSVICAHVPGIRTAGGSASLWQSVRPMAQHLTRSESPLIPAHFKLN